MQDEQPEARVLLRNYCDAFNDAILLPGFLLGCADNIFKSKDHKYPDIMAGWCRAVRWMLVVDVLLIDMLQARRRHQCQ